MAHIIITDNNRKHLIRRASERFKKNVEVASMHIDRIKSVLGNESPDDWRFTRSPVAKFLIYDSQTGFRILGRTYRDVGSEIIAKLEEPEFNEQKVKESADEYLNILKKPDAKIVHELKTIYRAGQEVSDIKHIYWNEQKILSHIIPIDARRIAARPNAIIDDRQLWVRQEELLSISDADHEYLLFECLTCHGIDKSFVRVYIHDIHGNIKHDESQDFSVHAEPYLAVRHRIPDDFRTATYWNLPTYLDACYLDLDYKRRAFPAQITDKEALLLFRIELINARVKEILGF